MTAREEFECTFLTDTLVLWVQVPKADEMLPQVWRLIHTSVVSSSFKTKTCQYLLMAEQGKLPAATAAA